MSIFLDSNFLVYAYSKNENDKSKAQFARQKIRNFWLQDERPTLSIQVLQETHVNLLRYGYKAESSWNLLKRYLQWPVMENTKKSLSLAMEIQQLHQLSFWDSHMLAAANLAGVNELWSEDMNAGQVVGEVKIVNPFYGLE